MSAQPHWSEAAALDRWLEDLERDLSVEELVRARLASPPVDPEDGREAAYRTAARRWVDRGRPTVALNLLERGLAQVLPRGEAARSPSLTLGGLRGQLDLFAAGRPGSAGLPALTGEELKLLREAGDPDEAMEILTGARLRLEAHGAEARRLLRRWRNRKRSS